MAATHLWRGHPRSETGLQGPIQRISPPTLQLLLERRESEPDDRPATYSRAEEGPVGLP
jgi:hypothetical protein